MNDIENDEETGIKETPEEKEAIEDALDDLKEEQSRHLSDLLNKI